MQARKFKKSDFNGDNVVCCGYCDVQNLFRYVNILGYTSGTYGWNCDIYDCGTFYLTTGHRPFGIDLDYNFVKKYENKAKKYY